MRTCQRPSAQRRLDSIRQELPNPNLRLRRLRQHRTLGIADLAAIVLRRGLLVIGGLRVPLRAPLAALRELLLQLGGVEEHQRRELHGAGRREDRGAHALRVHERDEAAVIEVGMGEEHGVDRRGVVRERRAVVLGLVRVALEHAAVDEHLCA